MQKIESGFTFSDFGYCEDCKMGFDFWIYRTLEDAGHLGHKVRNPTEEELPELIEEEKEKLAYCDKEECPFFNSIVDSPQDREYHKGHKLRIEDMHEGDTYYLHAPICDNCHLEITRIIYTATDETVYSFSSGKYEMSKHREDDKPELTCGNYKDGKLCDNSLEERITELINY